MNGRKLNRLVSKGQIIFDQVNAFWKINELDNPTLKNISIHIKKGSFIGVTGKIGSGKSGLLGAMLDELPYYSG